MNNYAHGYQQYKQQTVSTMTPGEMLILLYDEMIKRLTKAELALKQGDYRLFDQCVLRVRDILRYLIDTLDWKYPISKNLYRLYDYFSYELSRARASRKATMLAEIRPMLIELRDAFKEADSKQHEMHV